MINVGEKVALESSNIVSFTVIEEDQVGLCELLVEFKNASYFYHDVDIEVVEAFADAESAGKFLRSEIIGKYTATKAEVDEPTTEA